MPVTPEERPHIPRHPQPWTLAEVLAMPEDHGQRVELIDGALHVSPTPGGRHQKVQHRMQVALDGELPLHLEHFPGINVVLGPHRMLIPDLAIMTCPGLEATYYDSADLLMAVEIISPASRSHDKSLKRMLYAEAGGRYYLLVDPALRPSAATLYRLDGKEYVEIAVSKIGRLRFSEPFPVDIELV
ncbi:Uma2 family endonuclease [Actinokineospora xionganensis]|uniref:Uma2 family endonuclease n=1 Tax=Actinokineospora xionganensis TaxID=2684470 RepID=A0ABR7L5F9_9PSEU|nr:Uma2 family endonuclease [Actinokineospora xionganensis]MBC6447783.1 Uma2 family endonuclease [Actinokineospora xionganensis]